MTKENKKAKSIGSKIVSWIFGTLIVAMLAFEGYGLISSRSNHGVPNFFGYQFLVIQTDSMDLGPDTYPVDMGIVVKKVDPSTLVASTETSAHDGDVITFYRRLDGRVVTHRIIEIDENASGLVFVCLGDNLDAETCPAGGCSESNADRIPEADVMGKVVNKSAALGTAYRFLSNPATMLLLVLIPLAILVVLSAIDFVKALKMKQAPAPVGAPILTKEDMEAIKEEARRSLLEELKAAPKEDETSEK
ncbi:MAG: S26 family signal peptidase [Bacilli bacterium]|jgi:hypothetical protein